MQQLHSSGNARYRLLYHLVLVTKYRRRLLRGPMLVRCEQILRTLCPAWGGKLIECSGEGDHVHALLDLPPRSGIADVVNNLKTVTSRRLRKEFPVLRSAYRGKAVLWSPSYCVISAGGAPLEVLKRYIQAQERPA